MANLRDTLFDPNNIPREIIRPVQFEKQTWGFYRVGISKIPTCQCRYNEACAGRTCMKCFSLIPTKDDVIKTILFNS